MSLDGDPSSDRARLAIRPLQPDWSLRRAPEVEEASIVCDNLVHPAISTLQDDPLGSGRHDLTHEHVLPHLDLDGEILTVEDQHAVAVWRWTAHTHSVGEQRVEREGQQLELLRPLRASRRCPSRPAARAPGHSVHGRRPQSVLPSTRRRRTTCLGPWCSSPHLRNAASLTGRKLLNAAVRRKASRQRARVGPILPMGMPSFRLISSYDNGGSSRSRTNRSRCRGRSSRRPSRSAWCRSSRSSSSSRLPASDAASSLCPDLRVDFDRALAGLQHA